MDFFVDFLDWSPKAVRNVCGFVEFVSSRVTAFDSIWFRYAVYFIHLQFDCRHFTINTYVLQIMHFVKLSVVCDTNRNLLFYKY